MSLKKDIIWRVGLVYLVVLFFGLLIIGKILYLQFFDGNKWKEKANKLTIKDITINNYNIIWNKPQGFSNSMSMTVCVKLD